MGRPTKDCVSLLAGLCAVLATACIRRPQSASTEMVSAPARVSSLPTDGVTASSGVSAASSSQRSVGGLTASDIAILFPLKQDPSVDSVFGMPGTGVCNAPHLGEGGASFLPRDMFATFSARNFGATCPDSSLSFEDDAALMKPTNHLARLKGLDAALCAYENWRVVAFRYDPCLDVNATAVCANREARLIAQPVIESGGQLRVLDNALHLIYEVPDPAGFANGLDALARAREDAVRTTPWNAADDADPTLLRPHAGLRAEMNSCGGPMATSLLRFFTKNLTSNRLKQVAWMTSSSGITEWSFSAESIQGGRFVSSQTRSHSNFSNTLLQAGQFPFNAAFKQVPSATRHIAHAFTSAGMLGQGPAKAGSAAAALTRELHELQDPRVLSQAGNTDCASCHLPDQTLAALSRRDFPGAAPLVYPGTKTWAGFDPAKRSFLNLRNFGYGTGFEFGVAQRTIFETQQDLKSLRPR